METLELGLTSKQYLTFLKKKDFEHLSLQNTFVKTQRSLFKNSFLFFFMRYFFKKGHSLKIASNFFSAFCRLYTSIFENILEKKKKYPNFFFVFNMLRLNVDFFNINFFLS
jgi:Na+/melibiose symporter-like transporter